MGAFIWLDAIGKTVHRSGKNKLSNPVFIPENNLN